MPNGEAKGMDDDEFDAEQLRKGTEVELEHTNDPEIGKEIAKDHLAEWNGKPYYDYLEEMENKMKKDKMEKDSK